jgi:type IV secretion system protein TrbI
MPEDKQGEQIRMAVPPALPDPDNLRPAGLSDRHKRYIYYGVSAVLALLILANVIGSRQPAPANNTKAPSQAQQQNPSPAQIHDWENNLKQAEAQLEQETKDRERQLDAVRAAQQYGSPSGSVAPLTTEDVQRAALLNEATARQQYGQLYGTGAAQYGQASQKSQTETEQEQQAYKSLFADNVVRQETAARSFQSAAAHEGEAAMPSVALPATTIPAAAGAEPALKPASSDRKPLDFDPTQPTVWLPEGTVIEAVLTNRLDGDAVGPVDCMITADVYQPGTRVFLIPQGARVLGEASKVSSLGQARLAVAFHRILVPGVRTYSIPLDKAMPALSQAGDVGLHDKVNNHYFSIFGASLAVGAIGGLAQIGNGTSGFGYDPSVEFRNGVSQSMAQSASQILDRFLNRMPTITIREGTRVKIILTDDLPLPPYESTRQGGL